MYKLYLLMNKEFVIDLLNNACIPFDPANVDFQQYQKWLSEGNVPEPAEVTE